jgi:hypothetical protein
LDAYAEKNAEGAEVLDRNIVIDRLLSEGNVSKVIQCVVAEQGLQHAVGSASGEYHMMELLVLLLDTAHQV